MPARRAPLATGPFLAVCFVHFAAAAGSFQLLPAMPFRIRELGGSTAASGLFLGAMTYASALAAPWTGNFADLLGRRRVLLGAGAALALLGLVYALLPSWPLLVVMALPHGIVWSSLLTASAAYASDLVPAERRAEGIAYHGMAPTLAMALAPGVGFWLAGQGWHALCAAVVGLDLAVVVLAWRLPEPVRPRPLREGRQGVRAAVDWPVLGLAGTLFLASFGYGGVISFVAQLAEARGVVPKSLFFTVFAATIVLSRPLLGPLVDDVGPERAVRACVVPIAVGLGLLPFVHGRGVMLLAALAFGAGYSTFYPAFSAYVLHRTDAGRRGAAFGAMLAAFDIGIGTGSIALGQVVERLGYGWAFGGAALLTLAAWPWFALGRAPFERRRPLLSRLP